MRSYSDGMPLISGKRSGRSSAPISGGGAANESSVAATFLKRLQHAAGAGRDQPADDDVLLEPLQLVDLAGERGVGQHARGLLERRRRDERLRLQAGLGDALQHRMAGGRPPVLDQHPLVDRVELEPVDLLADQEGRVAGVEDLDLLQHLANDHLDVLVVDLHALEFVDLLDLVHQELGQRLDAQHPQQVVRHRVAVDDQVARLHAVAFLHHHVPALGDQVLDRLQVLVGRQDAQPPLVLVVLAELDPALDLGDDRRVLGPPRLEQLRHPRQTAGDVAGLAGLARQTGKHVAGLHLQCRSRPT